MAGALTAGAVATRFISAGLESDPNIYADIQFLSPVDGANNALLTAVVTFGGFETDVDVVAQWHRVTPGVEVTDDMLGVAVGDPFEFTLPAGGNSFAPVVIQAIDRGGAGTSAYGLALSGSGGGYVSDEGFYVDAILFD